MPYDWFVPAPSARGKHQSPTEDSLVPCSRRLGFFFSEEPHPGDAERERRPSWPMPRRSKMLTRRMHTFDARPRDCSNAAHLCLAGPHYPNEFLFVTVPSVVHFEFSRTLCLPFLLKYCIRLSCTLYVQIC